MDFTVPVDHRVKLQESEKKDKYLNLAREFLRNLERESDTSTNCNWSSWYSHERIDTRTRELGNNMTSGNHPDYCIIKIRQNSEKSPGHMKRLAVTQTPVKKHKLQLIYKTKLSGRNIIKIINKKKKNFQNCRFCYLGWPQNKTERKWKEV